HSQGSTAHGGTGAGGAASSASASGPAASVASVTVASVTSSGAGGGTGCTLPTTGNVYYVDQAASNASDSNPGTKAAPWKTIQNAGNTVQAGDTVVVE